MRYVAVSMVTDTQTHTHTHTTHVQNDYRNPLAHAPRVNNVVMVGFYNVHDIVDSTKDTFECLLDKMHE